MEIFPDATVAPEPLVSQHPSPSKWEMSFWGPEPSTNTDMSRTEASGTNRAGSRVISSPLAMQRRILPMPVALIEDPPIPLITWGGIGLRSKKSEASGEMWIVALESRMNALAERVVRAFVFNEDARKVSMEVTSLLLSCQLTEAE